MVYLLETKLLETKSIFFALSTIYGIGKTKSFLICKQLGFSTNLKVKSLSEDQILKILKLIETSNLLITSELKKVQMLFLKRLISIKSYRGLRRIKGLPVRGQRTHTNAKTARKIK
jgi:small subunit ribosomal protein S13